MPEQITQKLGFDASAAITSLTNLNQKLGEFRQGLQATAGGLRKFEKNAATAVATFNTLGKAAILAAASVNQLRIASGGVVPPQVASQAAAASAAMGTLGASAVIAKAKLGGLAAGATTSSAAVAKVATAATAAAAATQAASAKTVAAANRTSAALAKVGKTGEQAGKSILVSWKTIGRIILAQAVIRGLSMLVSTFNDAQEAAREFSLRVGEISTIAGGALGSINEISDATLELSRNLGIATDEVAEGLYQTLSNQVVEAGEAIRFETTAAKLSITTHSQLKESINALSSVMNSYQLDISEAEEVSAVLFKTVELGRLRMGEFGDVLGRVSPLTAALGISYKEMAASLAAITQKGVPAHTAITQLTAVTQKLLRPTDKLQELYHKWGVETGPEAIRRFGGLRGVLLKMKDATAGNDKEFADLLGRIRSMVGAMNLTTDKAGALTHALDEMLDPTADLDAAFAKMESTIGRRSVKAWDDIDVSIHKAGKTFLEVTTPMVEILGTVARNSDYAVASLVGLAAGALLVTGKVALAGAAVLGFNVKLLTMRATLLTLWPVLAATVAAIATIEIKKAFLKSVDTASDAFTRLKESQEKLTKSSEENSKKRIDALRKENAERQKLVTGFIMSEEKAIRASTAIFAIESEAISDVLGDTLESLTTQRMDSLKTIEDAVNDMDGVIKGSQEVIKATQEAIANLDYSQRTKHLSEEQKLWSDIARSEKAATEGAKAYADAQLNEDDIKAARKQSIANEAVARKNLAEAEKQGNASTAARAVKNLRKILTIRLKAEGTVVAERKALNTAEHKLEIKRAKEALKVRDELLEKQRQFNSGTDKDGKAKSADTLTEDREKALALGPAIEKAIKDSAIPSFAEALKIEELQPSVTDAIQGGMQDAVFQWDSAIASLDATLRAETFTVNVVTNLLGTDLHKATEEAFGETGPKDAEALERFKQTSEAQIAAEGEALQQFEDATAAARENLLIINENLDPGVWSVAGTEAARIADRLQGWSFPDMDAFRSSSNEAYFKISGIAEMLRKATEEERALTGEEVDRLNALSKYVELEDEAGNLTGNRLYLARQFTHQFAAQNEELNKQVAAVTTLKALGEGPDQARAHLSGLDATAEVRAKKLKEEVDGVHDGVKATTDESKKLPAAVDAGTASFVNEAEAAKRVKLEAQGTLDTQQRLNQLKAQPQTAPAAQPAPVVAPTVDAGSIKAGTEALKPMIKGIEDVKQSSEDAGNNFGIRIINGVTQAMPAIQTLDGAVVTLAGTVGTVTANVGAVNTAASTTANTVRLANDNTSTWATGMGALATAAQGVVLAMQAAEQAAKRAAQATALAAQAAGGGAAGTAFSGGPAVNYRAAGGLASRGKDTIPVMASPGERITSARNSRRFASELQAINAGKEPIFRDKGGSVTNVGDVNVSVTSGETASQTARQIATSLRRELRRGTSRL